MIHDFRRTASTHLHEAGFNSDWIEKALAHEAKGIRGVYNRAQYAEQRREMLQWCDDEPAFLFDPFSLKKPLPKMPIHNPPHTPTTW